jgi:hypothetical protein
MLLGIQRGGSRLELFGPDAKLLSGGLGPSTQHQFVHSPREAPQEHYFHGIPSPELCPVHQRNFGVLAQAR